MLNSHIKAMQHLKEVNKIHYKEYNLTDLEALSIVTSLKVLVVLVSFKNRCIIGVNLMP